MQLIANEPDYLFLIKNLSITNLVFCTYLLIIASSAELHFFKVLSDAQSVFSKVEKYYLS